MEDKWLWVVQDNKLDCPDLEPAYEAAHEVIPRFKEARFWRVQLHSGVGYLNNTHTAFRMALQFGAERIYYVEDDVVVTPDFFEWHEAVQADGDWMCSSAWRRPEGQKKSFDVEAYYQVQFPTTISIGTCFKWKKLEIALRTHDWNPQDRMLNEGWKCVMPYVPRCYHIGSKSNHPGGKECPPEAVDALPDLIPDYKIEKVVLR